MTISKEKVDALGQALDRLPDPPSEAAEELAPSRRRKGLVPLLEPGDLTALRLLASWRFASPVALAALSWPLRSSAGQEWRMRRLVDCGMLGRRRMRFATTRHAVWARSRATQLALSPPPPHPLIPPRWSEDIARHGWMRSVVAQAYVSAGWYVDAAGVEGTALKALKQFVPPEFLARVFPPNAEPYPFDLAVRLRKADQKLLLHILITDDRTTALDRLLFALPFETKGRSSRIAVRFFPVDDFTVWSAADQRFVFEDARVLRMHDSLRNAGFGEIPVGNEGPTVPPWLALAKGTP